jgi:CDP-diacylglycerol--serine O-phosphatidyltransferase
MNGSFEYAPGHFHHVFWTRSTDGLRGLLTRKRFWRAIHDLVDMVSFGRPALVMYEWALSGMGKPAGSRPSSTPCKRGLRLARFNTQVGLHDKRYFGLPSPAAAALVVGFVWVLYTNGVPGRISVSPR